MPGSSPFSCTIAIPVYNELRFFEKALASVLSQANIDTQVLVVDDGSKPEVWKALQKIVPSRVSLHQNPSNLGLFQNWNRCLELAQGRYFGILCSDDELAQGYLEAAVTALDRASDSVLFATTGRTQNDRGVETGKIGGFFAPGTYLGKEAVPILLEFYGMTGHNPFNYPSGVMVRTEEAKAIGGFDASMRHVGDLDFFFRLLLAGNLIFSAQLGCKVTIHEGQAGAVRAAYPYGMEEFQKIIHGMDPALLDQGRKAALAKQYRALALWHALKYASKGNKQSFANYMSFVKAGPVGPLALGRGLLRILRSKRLVQKTNTPHPWQVALNQIKL